MSAPTCKVFNTAQFHPDPVGFSIARLAVSLDSSNSSFGSLLLAQWKYPVEWTVCNMPCHKAHPKSDLLAVSSACQPSQPPMYVPSMISNEVGRGYETPLLLATIALCYSSWSQLLCCRAKRHLGVLLLILMLMLLLQMGKQAEPKDVCGQRLCAQAYSCEAC